LPALRAGEVGKVATAFNGTFLAVLRISKLKGAEYLVNSVARGMDEYYTGDGEAPGVWRGSWAPELGLEGVVDADDLRAIVNGQDPRDGADLLRRADKVGEVAGDSAFRPRL
jgi:hypothetical protein